MLIFQDRHHAGKLLKEALESYKDAKNTIVIGLPRGGVVLADEIAKGLGLPLDVISIRKIGAPFNPELALGAISDDGEGVFDEDLIKTLDVNDTYLKETIAFEKEKAKNRLKLFRKNRPPLDLKGKTVIVVDDGLATGATMKAAIRSLKLQGIHKIIVAVPVSAKETFVEIQDMADEVICLSLPPFFQAVGQFYETFDQTEDDEVVKILSAYESKKEKIKK